MSDLVPSAASGFQSEDAEHTPATPPRDTRTERPFEGFQAEAGEHSPASEERGPEIA